MQRIFIFYFSLRLYNEVSLCIIINLLYAILLVTFHFRYFFFIPFFLSFKKLRYDFNYVKIVDFWSKTRTVVVNKRHIKYEDFTTCLKYFTIRMYPRYINFLDHICPAVSFVCIAHNQPRRVI